MNIPVTKGLEHLTWLSRAQGEQFLACRRAGHPCAWRWQPVPGKKKQDSDVPFLCGFVGAGTVCEGA